MSIDAEKDTDWSSLSRELPDWFENAPFGIFIHWGAYSVPAWAEPIGALGTVDDDREWFTHNPYAEWYWNTIRIDGSPAQEHHGEVFGGNQYDDLLDQWKAEKFDPQEWAGLFKTAGADYVIPTTKHHDGITLWDAPDTGTRNTVHRGPRRDLVGAIAEAVRNQGMHLGLYYSGGLDWYVRQFPPHLSAVSVNDTGRPKDAEYAQYAYNHVLDLVEKYRPEVLWNDINWPDEGKHFGAFGLGSLFQKYYEMVENGVVNDRWGDTHKDYSTSEYEQFKDSEGDEAWENCRGLGFSFGYNQVEGRELTLSGTELARQLVDVVSRGGRFLLNIGPKADGTIPEIQRQSLLDLGAWMADAKPFLTGAKPATADETATSKEDPWIRWVDRDQELIAFVDDLSGNTVAPLKAIPKGVQIVGGIMIGDGGQLISDSGQFHVELSPDRSGPAIVRFPKE